MKPSTDARGPRQTDYGFWYDEATGALFDNFDDWWGPVQHTRGGVEGDYTNLFHDDCHYSFDQWTRPTVVYQPDHIMLLSAGCTAAIGVFFFFSPVSSAQV